MAEYEKPFLFCCLPILARLVREAVDGERYLVESDVVIDALREWELRQKLRAAKLERLRELVLEGLDDASGPMGPDEFEQIKREGRASFLPAVMRPNDPSTSSGNQNILEGACGISGNLALHRRAQSRGSRPSPGRHRVRPRIDRCSAG